VRHPLIHIEKTSVATWIVVTLLLSTLIVFVQPVSANPFETLPPGHWAYDALEGLVSLDLGRAYVRQRLSVGEPLTYFDLALWVGDALDSMRAVAAADRGGDWSRARFSEIVEAYNEALGGQALTRDRSELFKSLIELSSAHLEVLGYVVPSDLGGGVRGETSVSGIAGLFEDFRLRGEGRIRYRDVGVASPGGSAGLAGSDFEQSYSLRMSGSVTDLVRIGADLSGEGRMWNTDSDEFLLRSAGVDIGISHAAIARVGSVSGDGLNPMVVGEAGRLSGFQAGMHVGQVGSRVLVASVSPDEPGTDAGKGVVTAWDGSVQLTESLSLGATLASLQIERRGDLEDLANTVFRIGGTYRVLPNLTLAGEMAQNRSDSGGAGAVKVGAVLHPVPELTLGAFLYSAETGYRPLFSREQSGDEVSRLDLSAEVGRWILSFRRQNIIRVSDDGEADANVTTLALEYPVAPNTVARASHERDNLGDGDDGEASKTAFDIEVRLENGKVSLGYALEDGRRDNGSAGGTVRTTSASVELAVGPEARAQAGFLIVDQSGGSETRSNLGLEYDLGNASVSLQYEIFTQIGNVRGNVTTAEVAIRF